MKHTTAAAYPILLLMAAAAAAGCNRANVPASANPAPEPTLQVVSAQRGTLVSTLPATGTLTALPGDEAALTPQVSGTLTALPIRYGERVASGQIVARISPQALVGQMQQAAAVLGQNEVQVQQAEANSLQQQEQTRTDVLQADANLRGAQASLAAAQASLTAAVAADANARQSLTREQTLYNEGLVPEKDLASARFDLQTADAQVQAQQQTVSGEREIVAGRQDALAAAKDGRLQDLVKRKDIDIARQQVANAKGALETARSQLALYTIRSPLSGDVTAVGASVGESVDPATQIATVSNLSAMQLQVSVPVGSASKLRPGDAIVFTADSLPGRSFYATVKTISPQVDASSGAVPILAAVRSPAGVFKDDMTVSARIVTDRSADSVVVPQSAVLTDPDTGVTSVVAVAAGVAHVVPVRTGIETGGYAQIVSGLRAGETVATDGQFGIPDGTAVRIQPVAAPALPSDPTTGAIPVDAAAAVVGSWPSAAPAPGAGGQQNGT